MKLDIHIIHSTMKIVRSDMATFLPHVFISQCVDCKQVQINYECPCKVTAVTTKSCQIQVTIVTWHKGYSLVITAHNASRLLSDSNGSFKTDPHNNS